MSQSTARRKPPKPNHVRVGELRKPYGIQGWLWLWSFLENRDDIFALSPWVMRTATGAQTVTPVQWRTQGTGLVVQLDCAPDRNAAERLLGVGIWVPQSSLPELPEDEYYWSQLVGLAVVNAQDERLGVVAELFDTGAHPIVRVSPDANSIDQTERLIPWHTQTVMTVALEENTLRLDWPADF